MSAILLGAGASVPAQVPSAVPMVGVLQRQFRELAADPLVTEVYDFLVERLAAHGATVNIENVWNAAYGLMVRRWKPESAFVIEFDPLVAEFETRWEVAGQVLDAPDTIWGEVLNWLSRAVVQMTYVVDGGRAAHYRDFVRWAHETNSVVASLNYDNCVELAADYWGLPIDYGLSEWRTTRRVHFRGGRLHLLKLHGSITWHATRDPNYGFEQVGSWDDSAPDMTYLLNGELIPYIIFGRSNKLSAEACMLDLIMDFDLRLRETEMLDIVGYSFGDVHINDLIVRWLTQDRVLRVWDLKSEDEICDCIHNSSLRWKIEPLMNRVDLNSKVGSDVALARIAAGA